jgi:hypothetical protein
LENLRFYSKHNKILLIALVSCLFIVQGFSQNKHTVSGYVLATSNGEAIPFANVGIEGKTMGASTNAYGYFSFTLPEGSYKLKVSNLGYKTKFLDLNLIQNLSIEIKLIESTQILDEVVIKGKVGDENLSKNEMGTISLNIKDVAKIPVFLGEKDIFKTLQMTPGVKANSAGGSGFYVRGGNIDQNLILLDEAPIYNPSHLFGFFSVFNSDALKDIKLYKGTAPAQFGGRASSVLDIKMKEGNSQKFETEGGIGLLSSRLSIQGPIKKDKASFIISGRRTYFDILVRPFTQDVSLYFYDLNLKANYKINQKNQVFVSGYNGKDNFGIEGAGLSWGNKTATLRWTHLATQKLFINTTAIFSDFAYGIGLDFERERFKLNAGIKDFNLKQDFNFFLSPSQTISFGWNSIYHTLTPGKTTVLDSTGIISSSEFAKKKGLESGIYFSDEVKFNSKLSINFGLRYSFLNNLGPADVYGYAEDGKIKSITGYSKGNIYNTYHGAEPRINLDWRINKKSAVKGAAGRNIQYLHQINNGTAGLPIDVYLISSPNIKPLATDQVSVGYFRNLNSNQYEFSTEIYYKNFQNLPDYVDGTEVFMNPNIEASVRATQGRAYGLETYLKKNVGKLTGWASYTLAKTERKSPEINQGGWYPARQDRRHELSLVGIYEFSPKYTLSATWVYFTGDAVTFPTAKFNLDGQNFFYYSERNGYRLPNYHRADIGLTRKLKSSKKRESDINFSIYNLYNRRNAFMLNVIENYQNTGNTEVVKTALFGIVPSITYNFKF